MVRGARKASGGKKKQGEIETNQDRTLTQTTLSPLRQQAHHRYDFRDSANSDPIRQSDLTERLNKAIEKAIKGVSAELRNLEKDFQRELRVHAEEIASLKAENQDIRKQCKEINDRISNVESQYETHSMLLNRQERYSRKNNLRIVRYTTENDEECMAIAKSVYDKIGKPDCIIERAHRDGRPVEGRNRHILVKLSFFQDKLFILKNARKKLEQDTFFITDDLTPADLKEKKKWATKVSDLYRNGTKLRFQRGQWRLADGRPYNFVEQ